MSDRYTLSPGVAVVPQTATSWFVLRETGRRLIREGIAAEVVRLILADSGDEDQLVDALAARFPAEQVYFALIQLRKSGVISVAGQADPPDSLFYEALTGPGDNSGLGPADGNSLPNAGQRGVHVVASLRDAKPGLGETGPREAGPLFPSACHRRRGYETVRSGGRVLRPKPPTAHRLTNSLWLRGSAS